MTAEHGEDGPNYLAVLIANKLTAKPQVGVDYRGQNMPVVKVKAFFLIFVLYYANKFVSLQAG